MGSDDKLREAIDAALPCDCPVSLGPHIPSHRPWCNSVNANAVHAAVSPLLTAERAAREAAEGKFTTFLDALDELTTDTDGTEEFVAGFEDCIEVMRELLDELADTKRVAPDGSDDGRGRSTVGDQGAPHPNRDARDPSGTCDTARAAGERKG